MWPLLFSVLSITEKSIVFGNKSINGSVYGSIYTPCSNFLRGCPKIKFVFLFIHNGDFGEKLFVHLVDTPYYADGPKSEPLAHKDLLITHMENNGFCLKKWTPLKGNQISELYSKFIFVYRNDSTDRLTGD